MERLEIPNFAGGYNDIREQVDGSELKINECPVSVNVSYSEKRGAASKEPGESYVGTDSNTYPLSGPIQLLYEGGLSYAGGWVNKRIAVAGGELFQLCPANVWIDIGATGLNATKEDLIDATHYIDLILFADDGTSAIKKWDGKTMGALSDLSIVDSVNTPATLDYTAKCIGTFKDYLIMANTIESGTQYEGRYRWSNQGEPELWKQSDYNDIVTRAGDPIIRMKSLYDVHCVFKQFSLHGVTWIGGDIPFFWHTIDERVINTAPHSIAKGSSGLFFLCEEGIMFTDGLSVQQLPADAKIRGLLRQVYSENISRCYGIVDDQLHQYWLSIPVRGEEDNNYIIVYDWQYDNWKILEREANCLGQFTAEKRNAWNELSTYTWAELSHLTWRDLLRAGSKNIVFGKTDGYVTERSLSYNLGSISAATYGTAVYGVSRYGGTAGASGYDCYHETGWLEIADGRYTEIMRYQPFVEGKINTEFVVEYKVDNDANWRSTLNHTFVATNVVETPFINMRATGKRVKLRFSNNNADEYFHHHKGYIYHQPRGWR